MTQILPRLALIFGLLIPGVVHSGMSASEFEAYVTGKTLYFAQNGETYGAEMYLPNRRVRWSFLDGECKEGVWYPQGGDICFVYEDNPNPQCWSFTKSTGGLSALFQGDDPGSELYEAQQTDEPMYCMGPDVGV